MTTIKKSRSYFKNTPALIAAYEWILAKRTSIETDTTLTETERKLMRYRFASIALNKIWVENAKPTVDNDGKCLLCFGIHSRNFCVLDAVCNIITFDRVVSEFKIPVKTFSTYNELFAYIKMHKDFVLYKVEESKDNKYGLLDDVTLTHEDRHKSFLNALGEVYVDTVVSYEDKELSLLEPVTGTVALSHGSMVPVTLELYPYQEIIALK